MNFDHILENESFAQNCQLPISEVSGVRGQWLTCLSTRIRSESDGKSPQIINGEDFVTIHNATGSTKFEMKHVPSLLSRFKPDFAMVPFDEHDIPISVKRIRKAVDRTLKYENVFADACRDLSIPFISPIVGADNTAEKERSIQQAHQSSSGFAYCNLTTFDEEKKMELIKSSNISDKTFRMIRGANSPLTVLKLFNYSDGFDSAYVDDITAKGWALQLEFPENLAFGDKKLESIASKELLNLWDDVYFDDFSPIDEACTCPCCKNYKRSYVHHLLKSHEMLSGVLLMMHNLHQYNRWIIFLRSLE